MGTAFDQQFFRITFQEASEKDATIEAIHALASWGIESQIVGQYETPTRSVVRVLYSSRVEVNRRKVKAALSSLESQSIRIEEVAFL